jgi:hypothetical protein
MRGGLRLATMAFLPNHPHQAMPPFRPMAAALCAAFLLALALPSAHAAPPSARRLQLTIELQRDAGVQVGAESGRGKLAQQYTLSAVLHTDGTPALHNPLDPDDGKRQLERAQRTQQRVQQALQRQGGGAPAAPSMADIQSMQARAMQLQAKCGTDRECLMREASAMSAAQVAGGDRALQARLQGYGQAVQACERQAPAGAAREACIANARRQAGGGGDDGPADDAVETPYLHFFGQAQCKLDMAAKMDGRVEGRYQDVQGTVTFTETTQADARQRDERQCPLLQAVLDTRNGRLWTHVPIDLHGLQGVTVRTEKGRAPQRQEGGVSLRWHEATDWVQQRLHNLSSRGQDSARLPATGGQTEVKLRWSFEPL